MQLAQVLKHFLIILVTDGMDYTAVSRNLTFNATVSSQMVTISILDDLVVENFEMFTLALTSTDPAVILNPSSSNVTIEDLDSKLLQVWYVYLAHYVHRITHGLKLCYFS